MTDELWEDSGGAARVGHQDNRCWWTTVDGRRCRMAWRYRRSATDPTLVCTRHRVRAAPDDREGSGGT